MTARRTSAHGHPGGPGNGIGHHPVKRPLPELSGKQPHEKVLLLRSSQTKELSDKPLPLQGRPLAGDGPEPRKRLIHPKHRQ